MWVQCSYKHRTHLLMIVNLPNRIRHYRDAPSCGWGMTGGGLGNCYA